MAEEKVISSMLMDRGEPLGNSLDVFLRRALHTKVGNSGSEAIPTTTTKGEIKAIFNELLAVAGGSFATIVTYTVPPLKFFDLHCVKVEGDNIADYSLKINGAAIEKYRTWWCDFGRVEPVFNVKASAGDIITVEVDNWRSSVADFNATLTGDEYE